MPNILAFVAHPDDETYSFGGILALAARAGWRCLVCAATTGEGGERHDGGPAGREALAATRLAELAASCAVLGAQPPMCWRLPDGGLTALGDQSERVATVLHSERPDVVLSLGPDGAYGHPDHLAVVRWLTGAVRAEASPPALLYAAFPPGLFLPQYERCRAAGVLGDPPLLQLGAIGVAKPRYAIDITSVAATKLEAIAAHRSQLPGGDPFALFPPDIVDALLAVERFDLANVDEHPRVQLLLDALHGRALS